MRRIIAIISSLCVIILLLSACGARNAASSGAEESPSASSAAADFSDTDFSGHWAISQVFDSEGAEVSADKLEDLGSFVLELLPDGDYFVYDEAGAVMGQGSYKVEKDVMILEAGGVQTIYTVTDANTLRGATADGCVTILTRQPEPTSTPAEQELDDAEGEDASGESEDAQESAITDLSVETA